MQRNNWEGLRMLPHSVGMLLALSLALKVPMDAIIAPNLVETRSEEIERRRALLEPPELPGAQEAQDHD